MEVHESPTLFDLKGREWPAPSTTHVVCRITFDLVTADPGYQATVVIHDGVANDDLEWSNHELAYTVGGWAQAMSLVAWQLERSMHHLQTFD
jgi:hypothetical protein